MIALEGIWVLLITLLTYHQLYSLQERRKDATKKRPENSQVLLQRVKHHKALALNQNFKNSHQKTVGIPRLQMLVPEDDVASTVTGLGEQCLLVYLSKLSHWG